MTLSDPPAVRPGGPRAARSPVRADTNSVALTLARAFHDDPLVLHLIPEEQTRPRKLPLLFNVLFQLALPFGGCDVTEGYESVALWRPPNKWHMPFWQYLTNGLPLLRVFGANALGALATMDVMERVHPHVPHWYLQTLGTDPAKQGKGYGGILLRHRLRAVDAAGLPAYLESSKESNIPIYASFGFEVTGEIRIPSGPTLYPMWRKPREPGSDGV